jgi:hypothetical protein
MEEEKKEILEPPTVGATNKLVQAVHKTSQASRAMKPATLGMAPREQGVPHARMQKRAMSVLGNSVMQAAVGNIRLSPQ